MVNPSDTSSAAPMVGKEPQKHTLSPYVTGSSVLGVKYAGGVMIACDTLCSYGSQARYKEVQRVMQAGLYTIMGASGEYSDFQYIQKLVDEMDDEDWVNEDGCRMGPTEYSAWLGRIMYNRRSKINPLWNSWCVGGVKGDKTVLKYIDMYGLSYEEDFVATGFGMYLAIPLLRKGWKPDLSETEARALLKQCLQVLFYRDCRASNRVQFSTVTKDGVKIEEPFQMDHFWQHPTWMKPTIEMNTTLNADSW